MILWTIQHIDAWSAFQKNGFLQAEPQYIDQYLVQSYDWMVKNMKRAIGNPPKNIEYPIWAWAQYENQDKKKPDLRSSAHLPKGSEGVRIEFEINENNILLSDFDLWHYVLNYWYLPKTEKDRVMIENILNDNGYYFYEKNPIPNINYHNLIKQSWDKIFDIEWEEKEITSLNTEKSIQATFWELKLDNVINVTQFVAR